MRVQLLDPPHGKRRTVDVVLDAVFPVHAGLVSRGALSSLTELELALVYDWAERERRAAVDAHVGRRPRPTCLDAAIVVSSLAEIAASGDSDAVVMARFRERLAELSMALTSVPAGADRRPASVSVPVPVDAPTGVPRERVGHRVSIEFVLRLPPDVEPPTPTREAVDAAALAMAGPDHEIGPDAKVSCVEAYELWEALSPLARTLGESARSRIHRTLTRGGVTSSEELLRRGPDALRQLPGIGEGSIRALSRAGLLGRNAVRRRQKKLRRRTRESVSSQRKETA